jgi:superfamily II DNA or RNA helicase
MTQKHLAPLPWIHLSESLRPTQGQIRIMLDAIPSNTHKSIAQLFYGNSVIPITDPHRLLDGNINLSIRQKSCIQVLALADTSSVKRDRFLLSPSQLATLFHFVNDVTIEIRGLGAITPALTPARIQAQFCEDDTAIQFIAANFSGQPIHDPLVLGEKEAYLLDNRLSLFHLDPPLLPSEAEALLGSSPLSINALNHEDAQITFNTIAGLGVDLACMRSLGKNGDEPPLITLRTILTTDKTTRQAELRLHLVTSFQYKGLNDEVEIPARGALSPLFPLCQTLPTTTLSLEALQTYLMLRPVELEEEARQAIFSLGAVSSSTHRGFKAEGQRALDLLSAISSGQGLPLWLNVDKDTLPQMITLPEKPLLSLTSAGFSLDDLVAQLKLDHGIVDLPISDLLMTAKNNGSALVLEDDTIVTFSHQTAKALEVIAKSLDLHAFNSPKNLSFFEAALLLKSLQNQIQIECNDDLKKRLLNFVPEIIPQDKILPSTLLTELRPYQHDAVTWMSQLHRAGLGRLLADDMGLGKTLMVLTLLAKIKQENGAMPNLVVAPTSVIDVWIQEARRHFIDIKVFKWHGTTRVEQFEEAKKVDIIVTSYALLRKDIDAYLSKVEFRYLILDEAQNIKNPRTDSWKSARRINAQQRLALTGTPIENRVLDLYSIIELVAPAALGTERYFARHYANPIASGNTERTFELKERLNPLILRRKKNDVERDLPPKIESVLRCEMLADQRALYHQILKSAQHDLKDYLYTETSTTAKGQMPLLAALTRLRQICCDPRLIPLEASSIISSAKSELFVEVLKECLSMDRRIIVYSQFIKMQRIIHELIKQSGIEDALWLHGGTKDRADVVRKFQDPDGPRVIVVSLKAGGTGITLTAADTVIYYDPWWNPAVLDQAADRAHRIGQTKTVHLIKLICENSIEEQILALSDKKQEIAEGILSANQSGRNALTMDDIKRLLAVEFDRIDHLET